MKCQIIQFLQLFICISCIAQDCVYEGYYLTQSVNPNNKHSFWLPDHTEVQGVANDSENWFITTTHFTSQWGSNIDNGRLWRIPLSVPLDALNSNPNVTSIAMTDIPEFITNNFTHFGDADHYFYEGNDYILVPIYNDDNGVNGIIACFGADDLDYKSYSYVNQRAGWCAVDNDGYLYVPNGNNTSSLERYEINWNQLTATDTNHDAFSNPEIINLSLPNPNYSELISMQGGEFSESGQLLYISSGAAGGCIPIPGSGCGVLSKHVGPGTPKPSDGIHVFDTNNWTEIQTSTKDSDPTNHFVFQFDSDLTGEQPQGLTVWDLDNNSAPDSIKGKLHVLIFDFDFGIIDPGDHEFSMHHFSNIVYVDGINGNSPPTSGIGKETIPFYNFNDAFFYFPIWDGAEIKLNAGIYPDTGVYNKKIRITSKGGSAIIGQQ